MFQKFDFWGAPPLGLVWAESTPERLVMVSHRAKVSSYSYNGLSMEIVGMKKFGPL